MQTYYQQALDGTLTVVGTDHSKLEVIYEIKNQLPIALRTFCTIWDTGRQVHFAGDIAPGETLTLDPTKVTIRNGTFCILRSVATGGLVAVVLFSELTPVGPDEHAANHTTDGDNFPTITYEIDQQSLVLPNDIGPYPASTQSRPIPPDSGRVVVGCGSFMTWVTPGTEQPWPIAQQRVVMREQYWRRLGSSFSVGPGETRTISLAHTTGMSRSSSDTETLATSVGTSVSGGLGPFSASISASINASSTSFQEISVHEETTTYEELTATAPADKTITYMAWQLTDILTVFDAQQCPLASVVNAQAPVLISASSDLVANLEAQRAPANAGG